MGVLFYLYTTDRQRNEAARDHRQGMNHTSRTTCEDSARPADSGKIGSENERNGPIHDALAPPARGTH